MNGKIADISEVFAININRGLHRCLAWNASMAAIIERRLPSAGNFAFAALPVG
jgi:hypothetical protein